MQFTPLLSLFGNLDQLDNVRLNFNQESVNLMNIAIAFIMFGVALSIRPMHFKTLVTHPQTGLVRSNLTISAPSCFDLFAGIGYSTQYRRSPGNDTGGSLSRRECLQPYLCDLEFECNSLGQPYRHYNSNEPVHDTVQLCILGWTLRQSFATAGTHLH